MSYLSTIIIGTFLYNKCPKGIEALRVFLSSFLVTFSSFFYLANKRKKKKVQKIYNYKQTPHQEFLIFLRILKFYPLPRRGELVLISFCQCTSPKMLSIGEKKND